MSCCSNINLKEKILEVDSREPVVNILYRRAIDYMQYDGYECFILIGENIYEREILYSKGWHRLDKSYMWTRGDEKEIQEAT